MTGTFTISIDLELAWAACDLPITPDTVAALEKERDIVRALLQRFARHDIAATWAVVGHLLRREPCAHDHGCVHPEYPRPIYTGESRDWFFQHPPADSLDPLWHAPDVIATIRDALPSQRFATHTFAHLIIDEARINRSAVAVDLAAARAEHQQAGLPCEVLVFPRNEVGCLDVVAAAGIRSYRGPGATRAIRGGLLRPWRRATNLLRYLVAQTPPVFQPHVDAWNMVDVPGSMLLLGRGGMRRGIPRANLRRMAVKGLHRAIRDGAVFHLWFHPANFADDTDGQLGILDEILDHAAVLRKKGLLRIMPMEDIAAETAARGGHVERVREEAVRLHDEQAPKFVNWYAAMSDDVRSNAFAYGRAQMNAVLEPLLRSLPRGARVLDVGCGTGEQVRWIRSLGLEVVGVEPAAAMRAAAQQLNPGVEIADGTADRLPFADGSFDLVLSLEVVRYLATEDVRKAYVEMLRVLKPGGRLVCSLVNRYALDGFYLFHQLKQAAAAAHLIGAPAHCEFTTPADASRLLTALGARRVDTHGRMFAPLRIAYKIHPALGRLAARAIERFEPSLAARRWHTALAGHLLIVAEASGNPAARADAHAR